MEIFATGRATRAVQLAYSRFFADTAILTQLLGQNALAAEYIVVAAI